MIFSLLEDNKLNQALDYSNIILSVKNEVIEEYLINYLLIYHFQLRIFINLNQRENTINVAHKIIELASTNIIKQYNSHLLKPSDIEIIEQNAKSILFPLSNVSSIKKKEKNFSRNEILKVRYKDGSIVVTKFKKVQQDLINGNCIVLEN